ncbi:MAG: hypothetical protein Q7J54_06985 [Candidatus Woesearchaeota archaeon]|nr:hypothetical protein [Candidatus Woesearchaeota archaeon]
MAIVKTIKGIASNEHLGYILRNFAKEGLLSGEFGKFLGRQFFGITQKPKDGLRFENHSHSHLSDGDDLDDIVKLLFKEKIPIWSLTDHGNSEAFDQLKEGRYKLNIENKYELDVNSDGRSLVIHSQGRQLVLLRSIEYWTDKGELGIHGYKGKLPNKKSTPDEAIDRALDMGGYAVINHPYFWEGLGFHGKRAIEQAIKRGAIAIEKNGTESLVQIYSAARSESDAKQFKIPLITSGDAHKLYLYGLSGITFDEKVYEIELKQNGMNHADAVKDLVSSGNFKTYLNYLNLKECLKFFPFGTVKEAENE